MRRSVIGFGIAALFCVGLFGCGGEKAAQPKSGAPETSAASAGTSGVAKQDEAVVMPVEVCRPKRGEIAGTYETTARVSAENHVDVVSKGIGRCVSLEVEEGERVSAGQVLAKLDQSEVQAAMGQTEVQVRQTKAQYDTAMAMEKAGIGRKVDRENAQFAYEQAQASRRSQEVQLENLTIRAPISGVVTKRNIQIGTLVTSGTPAFTIIDPASLRLTINPPERELPNLKLGQMAKVTVDAAEGKEFVAKVARINPTVDSASGTVKVVLDFARSDLDEIKEGAFARVRLVLDMHSNAMLLPKDVLLEESGRKYVFVVETSEPQAAEGTAPAPSEIAPRLTARRVDVQIGLEDSSNVEIVSGLADDTRVVSLGQQTLKTGAEVKITNLENELSVRAAAAAQSAANSADSGQ